MLVLSWLSDKYYVQWHPSFVTPIVKMYLSSCQIIALPRESLIFPFAFTHLTQESVYFFSDNSHYIGYNGTFICLDSFSCDANKCIIPVHDNEWGYIYWSFHLLVQCIYVCVYVIMHCLFIYLFIHYIIWYIKLLQAKCTGMLLCKCLVLEGFSL